MHRPAVHCLHTVGSLNPDLGGPTRSVTALCAALVRSGVEVDLLTVRDFEEVGSGEGTTRSSLRTQYCSGNNSALGFIQKNHAFASAIDSIYRSSPNGEL